LWLKTMVETPKPLKYITCIFVLNKAKTHYALRSFSSTVPIPRIGTADPFPIKMEEVRAPW